MNPTASADLAALADHLAARRGDILAAWSTATRRDPEVTTATTLSRTQFYDHIPHMLDALDRKLRATQPAETFDAHRDETVDAGVHGLQRWQQGYNEGELLREWVSLNACLADELARYADEHSTLDCRVMSTAWGMLSEFSLTGMSESVTQYSRLQQTEAAGRVQALEEALRRVNELEAQRAALWREATHDLRGNLGVVRNVAHVLQRTPAGDDSETEARHMLERGVASLHALLDDLTVQARLDAGQERRETRSFDAAAALQELCAHGRLAAEERGLFLRVDGPGEMIVEGDEVKIRRIAQNLLLNALLYTKQGGVAVTWEALAALPRRWVLCVKDTGPGLGTNTAAPLAIALEAATRERQSVADDARDGNHALPATHPPPTLASASERGAPARGEGVGLSIVKRLCELLDAGLELQTAPGTGTTFRVTFPSTYPKG